MRDLKITHLGCIDLSAHAITRSIEGTPAGPDVEVGPCLALGFHVFVVARAPFAVSCLSGVMT